MSHERRLNFFRVPEDELIAEEMRDYREMIFANLPEMQGLPEGVRVDEIILNLTAFTKARQHAEEFVKRRYRLPKYIKEAEIVDVYERGRITGALQAIDDFVEETARSRQPQRFGTAAGFITLWWPHENTSVNWSKIVFDNKKEGYSSAVFSLQAFLDGEHFEDYCNPGKGSDKLTLSRDKNDVIQSYHIVYKGEDSPQTPWEYMHRDDLPVISEFVGRTQRLIESYKTQSSDVRLDVDF